ncbi:MAG: zinc-dependent metalloprotease [Odoribacteraceae bacterium]|jgi:hypothetical protein|nr:zinc-dependent metalloprotease [Odoribacteraceae bacterium]
MKNYITLLITAMILLAGATDANAWGKKKKKVPTTTTETPAPKKQTPYEKLFKGKDVVTATSNFITLRRVGDKLYFEIPVKYFDREMLLASTVSSVSMPDFCDVGYKPTSPLHVKFTRTDSTVYLRQISSSATTDNLQKAVSKNYGDAILYAYGVKAYTADSSAVVIDVTTLFTTHVKPFDFFGDGMMGGLIKITSVIKKEGCALDEIKSFDDNISVKSVLSYGLSMGLLTIKVLDDYPFTALVTRSLLLLPEEKMRPRVSDSRVGIFNHTKRHISVADDQILSYSVAHRWRLEPKDPEAYRRGQPSEPVQPITFYVDDAFPESWKAPIREAIERWNPAFEKIGFKNAVVAKDFPTDDPAFDPDNLKYSCVRYLPSTTANAMGPSWVDPTTGEIINASVLVYNNVVQLINYWRFVQTAQLDPRVRAKKMPDDVIRESLSYVVGHEIGHCLGFMHNMAASASYPVDSLRSADFTQRNGTTPCIMDYARFNYVAQPGDKGARLTPPDLGEYDYFLVKWNYQPIPEAADEWNERAVLERWVDEKAGNPRYRYGRQQTQARYDPSSIEEDLGDDPQKASAYGIKNLKYILANLDAWITDDPDYEHRQALHAQIVNQYYRYLRNVLYNVGGIYLTEVKEGTPGDRHLPVPRARQKASLAWVLDEFKKMDWVDNADLKKRFKLQVDGSALLRDKLSKEFKGVIDNVVLSAHHASSPYTVEDLSTDLYNATWSNLVNGRPLTAGDRVLQQAMVNLFCESLAEPAPRGAAAPAAFAPSVDEIIAYGLDETGLVARHADLFRAHDEQHGRGSVAAALVSATADNHFGTPGYGFQAKVSVTAIDNSKSCLQDLAVKSRALLRGKLSSTTGAARTHYQSLLIKLNGALKDKI